MIITLKPLFSISTMLGASALLLGELAHAQNGAAPNQAAPARLYRTYGKKASEVYKNIQVLKDIDNTELIPSMQFMAASLGVGCDHCHVRTGSDKDEKPAKLIARKMILMTQEINKNHFGGNKTISCAACHRGSEMPVLTPAIAEEGSGAVAAAGVSTAKLPTAEQILDKYLQAVGGAAAVERISTRVEKGALISGDDKTPYEIFSQAPDKRAAIAHDRDGDTMSVFNGTAGWLEIAASSPPGRDLTPSEIAGAKFEEDLKFALDVRHMEGLRVLPPEQIDGKEMYVVAGKPDNLRRVRMYFDEQSGLLTRLVRYNEVPLGFTPVRTDYADYREVDGVKIPFRRTHATPGGRSIVQIETVRQNVPIDAAKFEKTSASQVAGH